MSSVTDYRQLSSGLFLPSIAGVHVAYFDVTSLFGKTGVVSESFYGVNDIIRTVAIAQKLKIMTLILFKKHNATTLQFTLGGKDGGERKLEVGRCLISRRNNSFSNSLIPMIGFSRSPVSGNSPDKVQSPQAV